MRLQLFATCLGDLVFPAAVTDTERLLSDAGYEIEFPAGQVCCGQPAFNAGHRRAASRVARAFVKAFDPSLPIVCPSGSCTTMVRHYLPELIEGANFEIWELSEFLDRHDVALSRLNDGRRVAFHDSCHQLRELDIQTAPRRLLERSGADVVTLRRPDLCCGFGGTFSIRQPELSVAMADDKLDSAGDADVLVTSDPGCLMQLTARRQQRGTSMPVVHLATMLARGIDS